MKKILPLLLLLALLLSGCRAEKVGETENTNDTKIAEDASSDTETVPKTLLTRGDSDYGMCETVDGFEQYVNSDGVVTVFALTDAVTALSLPCGTSFSKYGLADPRFVHIGFDTRSLNLPEACVLRAQFVSRDNPAQYDALAGEIDLSGGDDFDLFRVWIEDSHGVVMTSCSDLAMLFLEYPDGTSVEKVVGIEKGEDEQIGHTAGSAHLADTPFSDSYVMLLVSHLSDAYAVYH